MSGARHKAGGAGAGLFGPPGDERRLDWEGCFNACELGGLPLAGGGETRRGAIVRGDAPDRLTEAGWAALREHGVRTIIDLRNADEADRAASPPAGIERLHLPLDGVEEDPAFWERWASGPQFATPMYYGPHLERFPERSARVLAAIATAPPGGVLFHCVRGRDRAGQITILLLAIAGVRTEAIAADYELACARVAAGPAADDHEPVAEFLAAERTTAAELIAELLEADIEAALRRGGLGGAELAALRARLAAPG